MISLAKEGCEAATLRPPADCDGVTMGKASYLPGARPYRPEAVAEYTAKGWWQGLTYGDVLDRSAAAAPQRLAVIDAQARLTYAELKERVDRFGVALRGLGIRRYDRVLLQLPNRHEFLIAFFAMHRIGAVPVLSIIRHEQREVCSLASLTAPVAWIVALRDGHRDFLPLIEAVRAEATGLRHVIVLTDGEAPPSGTVSMTDLIDDVRRDGDLAVGLGRFRPDANDVAFILPTGGTTGAAKGVPRTHNSYLANVRYTGRDLGPGDVVGLATPIGHSMAQQGALGGAMLNAATLAIVESPRAEAILARIQRDRISNIGLVPTQLEDILSHADLASFDLSCLRRVRTAGAALRPETAAQAEAFFRRFGASFGGGDFGSSEGPSATHVPGEPPEVFRVSVGKPMCEGDHWKVIDEEERELPPNTEGELAVRGPLVFTGYYRSEAENEEVFTADGYFKLGDLGRIDKAGYIYVTGRKKDIIQRGGETIVPGEIERLVRLHPSVAAAAVVAMPDARLGEKACAYAVLKPAAALSLDELVGFLKELGAGKLLLPEHLEVVAELARTPVGKVDKKALRQDIEAKLRAAAKL